MTIGIAAHGPHAGLAVYRALCAVERIAWGAIGGFASFAAISADRSLLRSETQRGGSATLFVDGESTGIEPPPAIRDARIAAVMSSGPDRPAPLAQFVAGDASAGLVSGHRLPNRPGKTGGPINTQALVQMLNGSGPQHAVDSVLDANPQADAGLIAVDVHGRVYARNSDRVAQRPDLGSARRERADATVEVLHNAIYPCGAIAALAAEIALETMVPRFRPDGWVTVRVGACVSLAQKNVLVVDEHFVVQRILTTDAGLLRDAQDGAAIYIGSEVQQDNRIVGVTITEPYVVLEDGVVRSLSGQDHIRVGFRHSRRLQTDNY